MPQRFCYPVGTLMAQCTKLAFWIGGLSLIVAYHAAAVPLTVCAAATAPALAWAVFILVLVRRDWDPGPMVAALLAGAVIAALPASYLNQALFDWLAHAYGEELARRIVPTTVTPVVEEIAKAVALALSLLVVSGREMSIVRGASCGALVGVGFGWTENLQYLTLAGIQGGAAGLSNAVYLRGLLGGPHHAAFAAATGAGLALGCRALRASRRWFAVGAGLAAAIVQHLLWNAVVAGRITDAICGAVRVGGPCRSSPDATALFVTAPLLTLVSVGPGVLTLLLVVTVVNRHAVRRC